MDLAIALSLLAGAALLVGAYAVRFALRGRAQHARVDAEGRSPLFGKGFLEMLYWSVAPVATFLARLGVTANAVTWASLVLGVGAGVAFGAGHFGLGALMALLSFAGDAIDGFVARARGTAGDAGEVLDAAIDRYVELAFLAGIAVAFRANVGLLVLTMGALGASFMVSYSTAKAEALQVEAPRGAMRRTERAVVLILGAILSPIAGAFRAGFDLAPMVCAIAVVAILGNISAVQRFGAIRAAMARRDALKKGVAQADPPAHEAHDAHAPAPVAESAPRAAR